MKFIPSFLLKQLYTRHSLQKQPHGLSFQIKNRLKDARLTAVSSIRINNHIVTPDKIYVEGENGEKIFATDVNEGQALPFPLRKTYTIFIEASEAAFNSGAVRIAISFKASPFGKMDLNIEDEPGSGNVPGNNERVPRDPDNDYTEKAIKSRWDYIHAHSGVKPTHIKMPDYDPGEIEGNCENLIGVTQVPLGLAGPLKVNGEHSNGQYLIPMATTEGTLVASYNRGIKLLNRCGGVRCTIQDDEMQRAPCFIMENALEAVKFREWLQLNFEKIKKQAVSASSYARLLRVDTYLAGKFVYCRFNFTTGDAAGQNMVTLGTFIACNWIVQENTAVQKWVLESNMATDKKPSHMNILHTRGKRVTAEAVLKKEVLENEFGVKAEKLDYFKKVGETGSFMAGSHNNSLHSANALAAIFIATGQDVANIAESCAGIGYSELLPNGDLYVSLTIPSLITATYGGGTGLPSQRECLEIMGCYGSGKVGKFTEIVAGACLAGELSLGMAIISLDWVGSHEALGKNR